MRIKEILSQYRRDFRALYECQYCRHETTGRGYDDVNFHENVIPAMRCSRCDKSVESEKDEMYRPMTTKYPEGYQI